MTMNWFRQLFARKRLYHDLSDEIREHIEEKAQELIENGMSTESALAAARRGFGNALLMEERGREVWRWSWLEAILRDIRFALRQLRRHPGFTLTVILTLALAIGANTAVFSTVNAILLRPLPYPEPDRLGALVMSREGTTHKGKAVADDDNSINGETWELVRDNVTAGQAAVWAGTRGVNLQTSSGVRYVREQRVSAAYFEVLGTPLLMGRTFTPEEDRPHGPKAVVLSYELWRALFSSEPAILGSVVHLKGETYPVVGVLAPRAPTAVPADLWTPLQPSREGEGAGNNYGTIFRLRKGATWEEARSQLFRLQPALFDHFRQLDPKVNVWLGCIPLQRDLTQEARLPILVLMFAVSCILLIASANLAGLMLVRIGRRSNELATRLVLGATRGALIRQVMMEPLILGLCGGALGFGLAVRGLETIRKLLAQDMLPPGGLGVDGRVFMFAAATSIGAILLIGLLPALELRKLEIRSSVSVAISRLVSRAGRHRARHALIATEVMLTVVLMSGAGLLVRTLVYLQTLPPGFDATNVMTAKLSLDDFRYHDADPFHELLKESVSAMKQIPGVESAAVGLSLPYERGLNNGFEIMDGEHHGSSWGTSAIYITPDYFRVLRIPVMSGREFLDSDTPESEQVAMLNTDFVRRYFGHENPIGRHVKNNGKIYKIVGVVGSVTKVPAGSTTAPLAYEPTFYVPATQMQQPMVNMAHVWFQPSWIVRTQRPIQGLTVAMQQALAQVDPSLPFAGFRTLDEIEAKVLRQQRVQVLLLGTLAGLALLLSLIGLYGLVSNLVVQRTREIGIRMALGSSVAQAMKEVSRSGILAVAFGLCGGLMLAAFTIRVIRNQLYGIRTYDPLTLVAVCLLLLLAALTASLVPTLRISRIDPATTLRSE
jgi:predicted permease